MSFWDSSAIIPLLVPEATSNRLREAWDAEASAVVWWGTLVECESALARRRREGLGEDHLNAGRASLAELLEFWTEVPASPRLRETAVHVIQRHALRAADAFQLAAALLAAAGEPRSLPLVTLDVRLRSAAVAEGFPLLPELP